MRIVQITINNFRTVKSLTFHPAQHNVLIGQVNAGKSTILNALALVLDPDTSRRFQAVDEMDFHGRRLVDVDDKPILMEIEVTLAGCSDSDKDVFLEFWEAWDDEEKELVEDSDDIRLLDDDRYEFAFRMAFRAAYDPDEDGISFFWYYPKFSFLNGSTEYRNCPRKDRERTGFFLIPAERQVGKALSFSRYSALDKALRADEVRLETQLRDIVDEVKGTGQILFDNTGFAALVQEIEERVDSFLRLHPGAERKILFELSDLGHYSVMNTLRAFIVLADQDQAYPIASQGMGAKQILVLAALRMLSERRQSSILAVEEPETGLHPHMQRSLVDDLLHSSSQTFITTHSVHVAQTVGQEYVFCLLNAASGDRRVVPVVPSGAFGYAPDTVRAVAKLNGHHPGEVLDSLFAPSVLLTEGVGDRQALPTLFRSLCHLHGSANKDLDGLGIVVVPCQSKQSIPKIAPYFKTQLGKQVYAIVDNEPSTNADNPGIVSACDHTFIWPEGCAIERVLLSSATDSTVALFIEHVTTELGDDYFAHAGSTGKDAAGKREDVFYYLKGRKAGHRHFAEFLPAGEIASPVKQLLGSLDMIVRGQIVDIEVQLGF